MPATVPVTAVVVAPSETDEPQAATDTSRAAITAMRPKFWLSDFIETDPARESLSVHHELM